MSQPQPIITTIWNVIRCPLHQSNKVSSNFPNMVASIAVSSPKSSILQNPICFSDPSANFFGGSLKGLCLQLKPRHRRRDFTNLVVASAGTTVTTSNSGGRFYFNFTGFPFPLGPFLNRSTIRTEVSLPTL